MAPTVTLMSLSRSMPLYIDIIMVSIDCSGHSALLFLLFIYITIRCVTPNTYHIINYRLNKMLLQGGTSLVLFSVNKFCVQGLFNRRVGDSARAKFFFDEMK